jgi:hypothetical protein
MFLKYNHKNKKKSEHRKELQSTDILDFVAEASIARQHHIKKHIHDNGCTHHS